MAFYQTCEEIKQNLILLQLIQNLLCMLVDTVKRNRLKLRVQNKPVSQVASDKSSDEKSTCQENLIQISKPGFLTDQ